MAAVLQFVGDASQYFAVNLPDFIRNVHFQCISFVWFVTEQQFLKVAPQKKKSGGVKSGDSGGQRSSDISQSSKETLDHHPRLSLHVACRTIVLEVTFSQ
jgi:hypothetical protein